MKRFILLFLICVIKINAQSFEINKPGPEGLMDVRWGASIEETKRILSYKELKFAKEGEMLFGYYLKYTTDRFGGIYSPFLNIEITFSFKYKKLNEVFINIPQFYFTKPEKIIHSNFYGINDDKVKIGQDLFFNIRDSIDFIRQDIYNKAADKSYQTLNEICSNISKKYDFQIDKEFSKRDLNSINATISKNENYNIDRNNFLKKSYDTSEYRQFEKVYFEFSGNAKIIIQFGWTYAFSLHEDKQLVKGTYWTDKFYPFISINSYGNINIEYLMIEEKKDPSSDY